MTAEESDGLVFREIRRADLPTFSKVIHFGIGKLEHETGLDEGAEAMFRMLSRWSVWLLFGFLKLIGRPFVRIWVAVDGARVVGTGTLIMLPKAGYVAGMSTDPEFRRRGVASRVLALEQVETVRRGRGWIVLDVESENETAIRVYRKAGYRDAGRYTWYTRMGIPPDSAPSPDSTAAATKAEMKGFVPKLDASRGADLRTALPADLRMLSHNELLVRGPRTQVRTWIRPSSGPTPSSVRAYFVPSTKMGAYFPTVGTPEPKPEELTALLGAATEWLRPQAPKRCIAVLAEPVGAAGAALERAGFAPVVSSTLMVRPIGP
jgi:ribosomal protein S18 acetylase RimI-like enzyme